MLHTFNFQCHVSTLLFYIILTFLFFNISCSLLISQTLHFYKRCSVLRYSGRGFETWLACILSRPYAWTNLAAFCPLPGDFLTINPSLLKALTKGVIKKWLLSKLKPSACLRALLTRYSNTAIRDAAEYL